MNLSELFPYHGHQFQTTDGQSFHGWLAVAGSASLPGLSPDYAGSMNLWTQDAAGDHATDFLGSTVADMTSGVRYMVTGATRYDDVDGGPSFWLFQVKESRRG